MAGEIVVPGPDLIQKWDEFEQKGNKDTRRRN